MLCNCFEKDVHSCKKLACPSLGLIIGQKALLMEGRHSGPAEAHLGAKRLLAFSGRDIEKRIYIALRYLSASMKPASGYACSF
jgi:hypothetical protein